MLIQKYHYFNVYNEEHERCSQQLNGTNDQCCHAISDDIPVYKIANSSLKFSILQWDRKNCPKSQKGKFPPLHKCKRGVPNIEGALVHRLKCLNQKWF